MFLTTEPLELFVDTHHAKMAFGALDVFADYGALRAFFDGTGHVAQAHAFDAIIGNSARHPSGKFHHAIIQLGWTVHCREMPPSATGRRDLGVNLAVEAMKATRRVKHLVLITGRADFPPLALALKEAGCHVTVVSHFSGPVRMCSPELHRVADSFVELSDIAASFADRAAA